MTVHYRGLSQLLCRRGLCHQARLLGHSFTYSFAHLLTHSFMRSSIHSFINSFIHLLLLPDPILTLWSQDRTKAYSLFGF